MKVTFMYFHGGFAQIPDGNAILQKQQSIAKESSAIQRWYEVRILESFIKHISECHMKQISVDFQFYMNIIGQPTTIVDVTLLMYLASRTIQPYSIPTSPQT